MEERGEGGEEKGREGGGVGGYSNCRRSSFLNEERAHWRLHMYSARTHLIASA